MWPRSLNSILFSLLFVGMLVPGFGQQTIYDEETTLFTKSLHGGVHIHPKGWGIDFRYGDIQTVDRTVYYGIEIFGMKHSKEKKDFYSRQDANAYTYGKLNSMYVIRPSIGTKRVLTDKLRKNGAEVSWHTSIGPVLAITKPIYLEIRDNADGPNTPPSVERYDPDLHNANNIFGRASLLEGFGELKIWPGAHIKSGLFIEFSPYQRTLKGVEVGMALDAYLDRVPLMAFEENNQFFHSFYINLFIGRKYNRSISE